jgi:pimeloyl-ACP methyl ester carboxylesterase
MLLHKPALEKGFSIIAIDRPGIGLSVFRPGWTVLEFAREVEELMISLGHERFGAIGISGAGPSLMAAAYLLPQRLSFLVDLACAMPLYSDPESVKKLGTLDRFYAKTGSRLPLWAFRIPFWMIGFTQKVMKSPRAFARMFSSSLGRSDREMFSDPDAQFLFNFDFIELFRQGTKGSGYDAMTVYKPWGFSLADIRIPIEIFHGTDDRFVPPSFSQYLKSQVKDATLNETEGAGHFYWLINSPALLDRIREKFFEQS